MPRKNSSSSSSRLQVERPTTTMYSYAAEVTRGGRPADGDRHRLFRATVCSSTSPSGIVAERRQRDLEVAVARRLRRAGGRRVVDGEHLLALTTVRRPCSAPRPGGPGPRPRSLVERRHRNLDDGAAALSSIRHVQRPREQHVDQDGDDDERGGQDADVQQGQPAANGLNLQASSSVRSSV